MGSFVFGWDALELAGDGEVVSDGDSDLEESGLKTNYMSVNQCLIREMDIHFMLANEYRCCELVEIFQNFVSSPVGRVEVVYKIDDVVDNQIIPHCVHALPSIFKYAQMRRHRSRDDDTLELR
jgi:hypothetical protein